MFVNNPAMRRRGVGGTFTGSRSVCTIYRVSEDRRKSRKIQNGISGWRVSKFFTVDL